MANKYYKHIDSSRESLRRCAGFIAGFGFDVTVMVRWALAVWEGVDGPLQRLAKSCPCSSSSSGSQIESHVYTMNAGLCKLQMQSMY